MRKADRFVPVSFFRYAGELQGVQLGGLLLLRPHS